MQDWLVIDATVTGDGAAIEQLLSIWLGPHPGLAHRRTGLPRAAAPGQMVTMPLPSAHWVLIADSLHRWARISAYNDSEDTADAQSMCALAARIQHQLAPTTRSRSATKLS
ncbi:hypothetical protein [Nonomuraea sp. CA-141351]|uniref:hypothetical protein n=1 Tax=Nonomuraea sp. CA-141351 TaxID=3239996 RepID=UPI003D8A91A2